MHEPANPYRISFFEAAIRNLLNDDAGGLGETAKCADDQTLDRIDQCHGSGRFGAQPPIDGCVDVFTQTPHEFTDENRKEHGRVLSVIKSCLPVSVSIFSSQIDIMSTHQEKHDEKIGNLGD